MLTRLADHPWWKAREQQKHECVRWERENPNLATDWNEALAIDARRAREAEEAELQRQELRRRERVALAMVPPRICAQLEQLQDTPAVRSVYQFIQGKLPVLLLSGGVGVGKTVAAALAVRLALRPGTVWVTAFELSTMPLYGEGSDARRRAKDAPFLVIDDLGVENLHDAFRPVLDDLVNHRASAHALPTVITTNLDVDALKARYGARITDRLRESAQIVVCGKDSLRRRGVER